MLNWCIADGSVTQTTRKSQRLGEAKHDDGNLRHSCTRCILAAVALVLSFTSSSENGPERAIGEPLEKHANAAKQPSWLDNSNHWVE